METEKCMLGRASCREFKEKQVPLNLIYKLLNCAIHAPSAGDLQNWKFVVVKDKKKIAEIGKACLNQKWVAKAPCLIVVCNDKDHVKKMFPKKGELYSVQSCATAAQNIILEAEEIGLGSCWIGAFNEETISNILDIQDVNPEIILAVGYPEEKNKREVSVCSVEEITYFDTYGNRQTKEGLDIKGNLKDLIKKFKK